MKGLETHESVIVEYHDSNIKKKKKKLNSSSEKGKKKSGPVRESNLGPLAPEARIMPLDPEERDGYCVLFFGLLVNLLLCSICKKASIYLVLECYGERVTVANGQNPKYHP